jgi:methyl-accepting chemotaxis protein
MALINTRLSNKLRLSTLVMFFFVLLGSFVAYLKMRQVSRLSESVAEARIPALSAVRDLRVYELAELAALQ